MPERDLQRQTVDRTNPISVYKHVFHLEDERAPSWVRHIDIDSIPHPDFAHSIHHVQTVRSFASSMAQVCDLGSYWKDVIDQAALYHDISQGLTLDGKVPRGPHALASAVIAYMLTGNDDVTDLVYSHNEDSLPRGGGEIDTAREIIRDADRLAFMGYSGLIRAAYYWGFRHTLMDANSRVILHSRLLCDPRFTNDGLPSDYEEKVRRFALKHLFPFLIKTGQLDRAIYFARTNMERFFGADHSQEFFLSRISHRKELLEKILRKEVEIPTMWPFTYISGDIQETNRRYAHLFIRKPLLDYSIIQVCERIQFAQTSLGEREAKIIIRKTLQPDDYHSIPWEG